MALIPPTIAKLDTSGPGEDTFQAKADFTFSADGIPVDVLVLVGRHVEKFGIRAAFAVTKLETFYTAPGDKTRISVSVVFEYRKMKP